MNDLRRKTGKDLAIILSVSALSAVLYLTLGGVLMAYGRDSTRPLLLRFLPVWAIQFGMSCLGVLIVLVKNRESLCRYGLVRKNLLPSLAGCLAAAVPTVLFLFVTHDIHGFLPFQGMFLTREILHAAGPWNVLGYLLIALTWGFGEGLFYVVLADKIDQLKKPAGLWDPGAFFCAVIAILIHGMVGFDAATLCEALATVVLMYGSLLVRRRTGNAWGNILIFFVVWNAF